MIRGLEHLLSEEKLRESRLLSLEKTSERPYSSLPVLKGGYRKGGEGLLIRECRDRTIG